jgi:hypothetical protein
VPGLRHASVAASEKLVDGRRVDELHVHDRDSLLLERVPISDRVRWSEYGAGLRIDLRSFCNAASKKPCSGSGVVGWQDAKLMDEADFVVNHWPPVAE